MADSRRPAAVFVLGLAPVKIGGMEKFLRLFVLEMDRAGWNTVLCFDGPISAEFRAYVDFPFCAVEPVDGQGDLGFTAAGALWKVLRKHRPQRFMYAFNGVMRCFPWLARLNGCRAVSFYDHSSRAPGFVAKPLSLPKRIVGRVLTAPLQQIVSVAEFTRRTGTALGLTRCPNTVLTNGVSLPEPGAGRAAAFRQRYGIAPDALVITQICWMVPVKGVEVLLAAAVEVLRRQPSARFVLVGDGPDLPAYRARAEQMGIASAVVFTGLLSQPTESGLLDATGIYCQPSLWQEACPLAVLEAMSFRLPVVASRIGGIPELVDDGRTGLLFPPGDSVAMADCLLQLAGDPELRRSMGDAAYAAVEAGHRIEQTVKRYVELVLNGPPRPKSGQDVST